MPCAALGALLALTAGRAASFRVALIAGAEPAGLEAAASLTRLQSALQQERDTTAVLLVPPPGGRAVPPLGALRTADAAVLHGGSGELSVADAALLRDFLEHGKGLVVLREQTGGWQAWPDFAPAVLGAKRQGRFAGGEPMRVINLFAHAIFTGVSQLETAEEMPQYADLASDAMLVIEGTVGEATAPLGWLRRTDKGRVAHLVPAAPELFRQPEYLRLVQNTIQWVARRPVPGARAIVQRTYLPDAYPGAMAITFPEGPTVCFDPTRGGVSQVADADFVDLRPRWLTKRGEPAQIAGGLFFQDPGRDPFWRGPDGAPAPFEFRGYRLDGGYPELSYRVGGRDVRERMRPAGVGQPGLVREIHLGPGTLPLRYEHQPVRPGLLTVRGATATPGGFIYESKSAGAVTVEIRPDAGIGP